MVHAQMLLSDTATMRRGDTSTFSTRRPSGMVIRASQRPSEYVTRTHAPSEVADTHSEVSPFICVLSVLWPAPNRDTDSPFAGYNKTRTTYKMSSGADTHPEIGSGIRALDLGARALEDPDMDPRLLQTAAESYGRCWKNGVSITGSERIFNTRDIVVLKNGWIGIRHDACLVSVYIPALVHVDLFDAMCISHPADVFPIGQCDPDQTTKATDKDSVLASVSKTAKGHFRMIVAQLSQEWCLFLVLLRLDGICVDMTNLNLTYRGNVYVPVVMLGDTFDQMRMDHPLSIFNASA